MFLTTRDTIVAVSTGWDAAALGIVRLSGPQAFALLRKIVEAAGAHAGVEIPPAGGRRLGWLSARLRLSPALTLPATVYWFRAPHSYTGQDVVELHTVGALPALRTLADGLIARGARRALPGEFTARAYLNGRLRAEQVEGVLRLIHAADEAGARASARLVRGGQTRTVAKLRGRVLDWLALVEAGIDFSEEEDVQFVTAAELAAGLDELTTRLAELARAAGEPGRGGKPHVALAGPPNAGKSTLFNALLGRQRAIVSPVLGTTRDVLSGEVEIGTATVVLQDCAGLGATADELEAAAHLAAERAAAHADVVLWVHEHRRGWDAREVAAAERTPADRRLLVLSQTDRDARTLEPPVPVAFRETVRVSAATGAGLEALRRAIERLLGEVGGGAGPLVGNDTITAARAALERARGLLRGGRGLVEQPELVAIELREAAERLGTLESGPVVEAVLGRIMARFCIGK